MNVFICSLMGLLLLCQSCMVGPRYQKPSLHIPDAYKNKHEEELNAHHTSWESVFYDKQLVELIKRAIKKNYDVRIALEKIEQARAVLMIKSAQLAHLLEVNGSITHYDLSQLIEANSNLCSGNKTLFKMSFDTSWELDFWGAGRRGRRAAYHTLQADIEAYLDTYLILLADLVSTYFSLLASIKKSESLGLQVSYEKRLERLHYERFKAGLDSDENFLKQQAQHNTLQSMLLLEKAIIEQKRISLAVLVGEDLDEFILDLKNVSFPTDYAEIKVGLPSDLLRRRPDIRKAEFALMAATELVGQAVAAWFPRISLFSSVTPESPKGSTWFSDKSLSWSIGPSVSWPILTFGRIRYAINERKSVRKQAILAYAQTVLNAFADVEKALVNYFQTKKSVVLLQDKVKYLKTNYNRKKSLFTTGLGDERDVIFAAKDFFVAQRELIQGQSDERINLVSLYKALGGTW